MITIVEVLMIVGVITLPMIPKKKKLTIDTTLSAEYGVDPDGYLVKL